MALSVSLSERPAEHQPQFATGIDRGDAVDGARADTSDEPGLSHLFSFHREGGRTSERGSGWARGVIAFEQIANGGFL